MPTTSKMKHLSAALASLEEVDPKTDPGAALAVFRRLRRQLDQVLDEAAPPAEPTSPPNHG